MRRALAIAFLALGTSLVIAQEPGAYSVDPQVADGAAVLREAPDDGAQHLKLIPGGSAGIVVSSCESGWCEVVWGGYSGWIRADVLVGGQGFGQAAPPAPICYRVRVELDRRKPSGLPWDTVGRPDPFIKDLGSGSSVSCENSYTCEFRAQNAADVIELFIEERDLSNHDEVGSGTCQLGNACRLGSASVSSAPC